MHTKRFNRFFKRWVQFRVGAIPSLPKISDVKLFNIAGGQIIMTLITYLVNQLFVDPPPAPPPLPGFTRPLLKHFLV